MSVEQACLLGYASLVFAGAIAFWSWVGWSWLRFEWRQHIGRDQSCM